MRASGVVADIIVFHPYDGGQWGFDCMGGDDPNHYNTSRDERYLKYLAARFASFDNVWWSMANEWSNCACKSLGMENGAKTSHDDGTSTPLNLFSSFPSSMAHSYANAVLYRSAVARSSRHSTH